MRRKANVASIGTDESARPWPTPMAVPFAGVVAAGIRRRLAPAIRRARGRRESIRAGQAPIEVEPTWVVEGAGIQDHPLHLDNDVYGTAAILPCSCRCRRMRYVSAATEAARMRSRARRVA